MHASLCRVPKCNTSKMKFRNSRKGESSCIPCERYVHTGLDFWDGDQWYRGNPQKYNKARRSLCR